MANYGEMKIKAQASRAKLVEKMGAYIAKEDGGEALTPEEASDFTELKRQVGEHDERICRLEDMQQAAMDEAKPVEAGMDDEDMEAGKSFRAMSKGINSFNINTPNTIRVPRKGYDSAMGRAIVGNALAKIHGVGVAKDIVEKTWGDSAVTKSLSLTTAQPIIPQDFALELIPLLTEVAVVRRAGADVRTTKMGNVTFPRQRLGSTAAYLSEGAQISVSALSFDNIQMTWHKYGSFTYTTREMLEFSPLNASQDITKDLVNKAGLLEDSSFLIGNGSNYPVTGLIASTNSSNVFANSTASGAVTFQTVAFDLQKAELNLRGNFVIGNYCWIMSPYVVGFLKQLSSSFGVFPFKEDLNKPQPTLNGWPVYETRLLATNIGASSADLTNIILVKADDMIIADSYRWAVSMSTEGSFIDGSTQVNTFGQDLVAFKLTNAHDFALKHDVSASIIQASEWDLGNTSGAQFEYDQAANTSGSAASSANH